MIYLASAWWLGRRALRRGRRHPLLSERQCQCRVWAAAIGCNPAFGGWYVSGLAFGFLGAILVAGADWNQTVPELSERQLRLILASVWLGFIPAEIACALVLRRVLRWLIPNPEPEAAP